MNTKPTLKHCPQTFAKKLVIWKVLQFPNTCVSDVSKTGLMVNHVKKKSQRDYYRIIVKKKNVPNSCFEK